MSETTLVLAPRRIFTRRRLAALVIAGAVLGLIALGYRGGGIGPIRLTAGATRTWVSGVGDDANPCSRTAPCKTWAGAISKTTDGGEIDALDPGGFGAVTITKPITLDGGPGVASILSTGTNAIVVTGTAGNVILRGLSLQGIGAGGVAGVDAIKQVGSSSIYLENVSIQGFTNGVEVAMGAADSGHLTVSNSRIVHSSGSAILLGPAMSVKASITHSDLEGGVNGVLAAEGADVDISNSLIDGFTGVGAGCATTGAGTCTLATTGDRLEHNGSALSAVRTGGTATVVVSLSDDDLISNTTGINDPGADGVQVKVISLRNSRFVNNATDGAPTDRIRQI